MPGETNLPSSIKLKRVFKNSVTYNNKYSVNEQTLTIKKEKNEILSDQH